MNDLTPSEKAARRAAMRIRAEKLLEQDTLEVRVDRLVEGALGFCHVEGFPLLIPRAAPGDLLRIRISERKKDYARAEIVEVLEPGPDRVDAPCSVYDRCGGCDLQHIRTEVQIQLKVMAATETLRRLGGVEVVESDVLTGASFGYRSRAQLQVRGVGRELDIGFFERGSKNLVPTLSCPVLVEGLETRLGAILQSLRMESEQDGGEEETSTEEGASTEEETSTEDATSTEEETSTEKESQVELESGNPALDEDEGAAAELVQVEKEPAGKALPSRIDLLLGDGDELTTAPAIEMLPHRPVVRRVGGFEFELDARCFFQGHNSLVDELVEAAVGPSTGETAFELHSGVGLFTLHLAQKYGRVFATESDRLAVRYLRRNAKRNKVSNVEVSPTSAERFLRDWQAAVQSAEATAGEPPPRADRWFLDPPRTGLSKDLIHAACRARPQQITYVSCQPPTLARDLKRLHRFYSIEKLTFIDMFPQTAHLETVVQLRARPEPLPGPPKPERAETDRRGGSAVRSRAREGGQKGRYGSQDRERPRSRSRRPEGDGRRPGRPSSGEGDQGSRGGRQGGPWGGPGGSPRPRFRDENRSDEKRSRDRRSGESQSSQRRPREDGARVERSGTDRSAGSKVWKGKPPDRPQRPDPKSDRRRQRPESGGEGQRKTLGGGWASSGEDNDVSSAPFPSRPKSPEKDGRSGNREPRRDRESAPSDDPWANAKVPKRAPNKAQDDE